MPFQSSRPAGFYIALALFLVSLLTIAGAFYFEYGLGLAPCPLCLKQRWAFYAAMPVSLLAAWLLRERTGAAAGGSAFGRVLLAIVALLFVANAVLAAYHAGVEWGFWEGPESCAGVALPVANSAEAFLQRLQTTQVVSCTAAAWRFLGLSLAGWNVLISLGLALLAVRGFRNNGARTSSCQVP